MRSAPTAVSAMVAHQGRPLALCSASMALTMELTGPPPAAASLPVKAAAARKLAEPAAPL